MRTKKKKKLKTFFNPPVHQEHIVIFTEYFLIYFFSLYLVENNTFLTFSACRGIVLSHFLHLHLFFQNVIKLV